jgi:hypothetical protein
MNTFFEAFMLISIFCIIEDLVCTINNQNITCHMVICTSYWYVVLVHNPFFYMKEI